MVGHRTGSSQGIKPSWEGRSLPHVKGLHLGKGWPTHLGPMVCWQPSHKGLWDEGMFLVCASMHIILAKKRRPCKAKGIAGLQGASPWLATICEVVPSQLDKREG